MRGERLQGAIDGVLHFSRSSLSGRIFHRLERSLMAQTGAIVFESDYARTTYSTLIAVPTCPTEVGSAASAAL